jgi:hypothetical protein
MRVNRLAANPEKIYDDLDKKKKKAQRIRVGTELIEESHA